MDLTLIVAKTTVGQNSLPLVHALCAKWIPLEKSFGWTSVGPHDRTTNNKKNQHFIRTTAEWKQKFQQNAINTCAASKNILLKSNTNIYGFIGQSSALLWSSATCVQCKWQLSKRQSGFRVWTLCLRFWRFPPIDFSLLRSLCSSDTCKGFSAPARANVCSNDRSPLHGPDSSIPCIFPMK